MSQRKVEWRVRVHCYPHEFEEALNAQEAEGFTLINFRFHPEAQNRQVCMVIALYASVTNTEEKTQ